MELLKLQNIDIENKTVFIRCDFNVPMDEYANITDDRRITSALSTIRYCLDRDCKIILASHMGRPKGKPEPKYSLKPIKRRLRSLLHADIKIASDVVGEDTKKMAKELQAGEILLLENLRFEVGEEKNDETLSRELASMADIYINDAFGVSHRAHASVHGITKFFDNAHKGAGFLLQKEVEFFHNTLQNPSRPFVAIVGGSKVSGKLEALKNLLSKVDKIIIGGGMAFTFLKVMGYEIGKSLVEEDLTEDARSIMAYAKELGVKFYLPVDVIVADAFSESANIKHTTTQEIPADFMGLDIGEASMKLFEQALSDAKTILWNGPMGVFEMKEFSKGSYFISHLLAKSDAITIIGGGDSADVVLRAGDSEAMSFISTGGGASLELLEGKVLPGVETLLV